MKVLLLSQRLTIPVIAVTLKNVAPSYGNTRQSPKAVCHVITHTVASTTTYWITAHHSYVSNATRLTDMLLVSYLKPEWMLLVVEKVALTVIAKFMVLITQLAVCCNANGEQDYVI